ncbi:2373_t:CDS:1, partial [Scutellospora calospora]
STPEREASEALWNWRDTVSNELSNSEEIIDNISENLLLLKRSRRNIRTVLKNQDYQEDQESSLNFILQQLQHLEEELANIKKVG